MSRTACLNYHTSFAGGSPGIQACMVQAALTQGFRNGHREILLDVCWVTSLYLPVLNCKKMCVE